MIARLGGAERFLGLVVQTAQPGVDVVQNGILRAMIWLDPERDLAGAPAVLAYDKICVRVAELQRDQDVVPGRQAGPMTCARVPIAERRLQTRFRLMNRRLGVGAPPAITDGEARRAASDENKNGDETDLPNFGADAAGREFVEVLGDVAPEFL